MSNQPIIDLELEAHAARCENVRLKAALDLSNHTTSSALRRIEQLTAQRRTLAQHILIAARDKRLDRRDLVAYASEIHALARNLHDHQKAILRIGEERDHLRMELIGEKSVSLITQTGLRKDLESHREAAHKLSQQLHRLRRSRRRVVA